MEKIEAKKWNFEDKFCEIHHLGRSGISYLRTCYYVDEAVSVALLEELFWNSKEEVEHVRR